MVEGNTFQLRQTRFCQPPIQDDDTAEQTDTFPTHKTCFGQLPIQDDDTAEHPHFLSSEGRELPTRDSVVQVFGDIRKGVTQSLVDCALAGQSTWPAIYSHHLARRKTRPAENSFSGKSGHRVQPHHSQPRRNQSGGNPTLFCNPFSPRLSLPGFHPSDANQCSSS